MKAARSNALTDLVRSALGEAALPEAEFAEFVAAMPTRWPNAIRHRREFVPDDLPISTSAVPWYRLARRQHTVEPDEPFRASRCLSYAAGRFYLQDAGSLLALAAAGADQTPESGNAETSGEPLAGKVICDLCAAPGGKASAMVEAIGESGFLLANEPVKGRLPALAFNLVRTRSDRYAVSSLDPDQLADRLGGVFDLVLVDAPCSGQALISRGRQNESALSENQISHSAARQSRIMDAAIRLLRPGGRLIYSTCTFADAENEAQAERLLRSDRAQSDSVTRLAEYQSHQPGCYRLWPHRHACAGSFAASLVSVTGAQPSNKKTKKRKPEKLPVDLSAWYDIDETRMTFRQMGSVLIGWPIDVPQWVPDIATIGPELAHRAGKTWKPSHAGALRRSDDIRAGEGMAVDPETAKQFLRGETIPCSVRGWVAVHWDGLPIGWVKSDGRIGKNHLPAAARFAGEIFSQ